MRVPLIVVTAWTFPDEPAPLDIDVRVPWQDELMNEAQAKLDLLIATHLSEAERALVTAKVIRGRPAQVLLDETTENDLLVIGSCGRGALEKWLIRIGK